MSERWLKAWSSAQQLTVNPWCTYLQALPEGEPWQRHVVLNGGDVTVEQWLSRRMLRQGRCHFCCRQVPVYGGCS